MSDEQPLAATTSNRRGWTTTLTSTTENEISEVAIGRLLAELDLAHTVLAVRGRCHDLEVSLAIERMPPVTTATSAALLAEVYLLTAAASTNLGRVVVEGVEALTAAEDDRRLAGEPLPPWTYEWGRASRVSP